MKKVQPEEGESANIVSENIERLKELFPDAFSEGGVNFDVLRQLLGDAEVLDEGEEKYGLNWHGKKKGSPDSADTIHGDACCLALKRVSIGIRPKICLSRETTLKF